MKSKARRGDEAVLAALLLDDIDSDYGFYSRVSNYLRGRVLRSEEEWESARSGQELIDELLSECPETKIKSLLRKLGLKSM